MKTKEILRPLRVPDIQNTKPEVFIIESLSVEDEAERRFEGRILSEMLFLAGKNPKYYYFQSKDELSHLVGLFRQSQYRYLHISTHASLTHVNITDGDISYSEFAKHFEGHLNLRRLFFSACEIGNELFVKVMAAKNKGMHSITAPVQKIQFDHAAALWSALYVSIFTENKTSMKHADIRNRLVALRSLFPIDFHFASFDSSRTKWNHETIGGHGA